MSFHGGLIGVIFASFLFAKKNNQNIFIYLDIVSIVAPIGIFFGRIANFINSELYGIETNLPWAVKFIQIDDLYRHPSQLYELALEGLLLFTIIWWFSSKPRPRMAVSGLFALCYGFFRFFIEFFREPDMHIGFVAYNWLTMGQLLCLPMLVVGSLLLLFAYQKNRKANAL